MFKHNQVRCSGSQSDQNTLINHSEPALRDEAQIEPPFTCLFTNNTDKHATEVQSLQALQRCQAKRSLAYNTLNSAQKRTAAALAWNVDFLARKFGIENLGFLTLTFAEHITCPKEAYRRFDNLRRRILSERYVEYISVIERMKNNRIHFHLLIVLKQDIRTGFDFNRVFESSNDFLKAEWEFLREAMRRYHFGRSELKPIKSTAEGIARYIGKYIGKHISQRKMEDKGVRLVRYSRGARMASSRMSMITHGHAEWRAKCRLFAYIMGEELGREPLKFEEFSEVLGPKWAYRYRQEIFALPNVFDLKPQLIGVMDFDKVPIKEYVDENGEFHHLKLKDFLKVHVAKKF